MAFTWGQILSEIRYKINEPEGVFFTDANLLDEWNQVQLFVAKRTKFLPCEANLSFQSDGKTVILPQNFLGLFSCGLSDTDGDDITFLAQLSLHGRSSDSQMGTGFYFVGRDQIRINAVQEDSSSRLKLSYYAAPTPFADETLIEEESEVPDVYIDVVTTGVAARAHLKRNKYEDYQAHQAIFMSDLNEAVRNECRRTGRKQIQIVY